MDDCRIVSVNDLCSGSVSWDGLTSLARNIIQNIEAVALCCGVWLAIAASTRVGKDSSLKTVSLMASTILLGFLTLIAMMYAMVANVVSPALTSVMKLVFASSSS